MTTATMERPVEIRGEWNHSCNAGCSNPCTVSLAEMPEIDVTLSPDVIHADS